MVATAQQKTSKTIIGYHWVSWFRDNDCGGQELVSQFAMRSEPLYKGQESSVCEGLGPHMFDCGDEPDGAFYSPPNR